MRGLKALAAGSATALVSVAIGLLVVEAALRIFLLSEPWDVRNFSANPLGQQVTRFWIQHDPILGYIPREGSRDGMITNVAHGVRLNRTLRLNEPAPLLQRGGILAVGDSFTAGSEVRDAESWPAYLEVLLGMPVVNAGVGGYGTDQMVLRAEQLLDIVQPRAIVVSFIPNDIGRNEYKVNTGLNKPYFDAENGRLVLHNVPVPQMKPIPNDATFAQRTLGYSLTAYWIADRIGMRDDWVRAVGDTVRVHERGPDVACLLWRRLAGKVAGSGILLVAVAQYAGIQVNEHDNSRDAQRVVDVLDCARDAGFLVIDSYPALRALFESDERAFWNLWVKQQHDKNEWHTGHMSPAGNKLTAELIAAEIKRSFAKAGTAVNPSVR